MLTIKLIGLILYATLGLLSFINVNFLFTANDERWGNIWLTLYGISTGIVTAIIISFL